MNYDFLNLFPKRMKHVGRYAVLLNNSSQKTTWKQYGFTKLDEQINLIFSVLLFIMEQSLKEEVCTIDDIGAYIDNLNVQYFEKSMTYEESRKLGDFVLNVILSNEGKPMYFDGYDFSQRAYHIMNISYVANRVVYVDTDIKRTSYYLTDDGYNLILSTLEIENNMKLTIHEMIFKMHLEKQSYDKAVDDIKNVFNLLRIQYQKIQEAMLRIRRNALNYSVGEYEKIIEENLSTISETKGKFQNYRELVKSRLNELENTDINIKKLNTKEEEKLENLRIIEGYLNRTIDEHQKILSNHFDLKQMYTKELEQLTQMSLIKRFSMRNDLYDKVLEKPHSLEDIDIFLRPLFSNSPDKIYNLKKACELQKPLRKQVIDDNDQIMEFGDELWQKEEERKQKEKLKRYKVCLSSIIEAATENPKGEITLENIKELIDKGKIKKENVIPKVEIFKEIMVELIKSNVIELKKLRKEKSENLSDFSGNFQLNEMILNIFEEKNNKVIEEINIYRIEDSKIITFENVEDNYGANLTIHCSNVLIRVK